MDQTKFALIFLVLFFAVFGYPRGSFAEDEEPKVDAVSRASWRPLAADEIISPEELKALHDGGQEVWIMDARDKDSFEKRHIEGAFLPFTDDFYERNRLYKSKLIDKAPDNEAELEKATRDYPRDIPIVTYCNRSCKASAALLLNLKKLGFTNVRDMEEGIQTWEEKGYPVAGSGQ